MNEEFNKDEFKKYIEETKNKIEEYKEHIIRLFDDIIPEIPNIEFVFRLDIAKDQLRDLQDLFNREN